jgi:hypothetical protein
VTDAFSYDGYGVMLGANPANAATSLLYTGEYFDTDMHQYYLRKLKLKKIRFLLSCDWLSGGRFYWTLKDTV